MGRYVLGGQKTGQKLVVELGVAQREPEDVRRAVDRNGPSALESGGRNSCNRGEGWERGRRNSCNRGEG